MVSDDEGIEGEWGIFCRMCFALLLAKPEGEA